MRPRPHTDRTAHYLAVASGGWFFGLPVDSVGRILRDTELIDQRKRSDKRLEGDIMAVLDVAQWFGESTPAPDTRLLVQLRGDLSGYAFRIERAIEVFEARASEIRSSAMGGLSQEQGALAGYAPWVKLAPYLVRGALQANNVAMGKLNRLGPLQLLDDELRAGTTVLNRNNDLVDEVKASTGFGCTIFAHDVRIATTAVRAGSTARALGSRAGPDIVQTVLHGGREFRGVTRTIGKDWAIVYRPLLDSRHQVRGMLATYQEVSSQLFPVLAPLGLLSGDRGKRHCSPI